MITEIRREIVDLYESGVSIEAIAQELGVEKDSIEVALAASCPSYKLELNRQMSAPVGIADKAEHEEFVASIKNLALHAENESVRARCAIYLHEEVIGRNERRIKVVENNDHLLVAKVLMINEGITKAREIMNRVKNGANKIVDINPPCEESNDKQQELAIA